MGVSISLSVRGSVPRINEAEILAKGHARVSRLGIAAGRRNIAKHTRTGETARNLRSRTLPDGVEFYDNAPQAAFLEYGTRPHRITAKNARALRWMGPSGPIFAKSVNHPGTRARPWLAPAIEDDAETLIGVYGNLVEGQFSRG